MARSILVIIWHLLADPAARFTDLGPGYYAGPHQQLGRIGGRCRDLIQA